jgi:hypothetical protein
MPEHMNKTSQWLFPNQELTAHLCAPSSGQSEFPMIFLWFANSVPDGLSFQEVMTRALALFLLIELPSNVSSLSLPSEVDAWPQCITAIRGLEVTHFWVISRDFRVISRPENTLNIK